MISTQLSSLLTNLGWGSGFRLPVANDENRALENLLEQKQKKLLEINAAVESDSQHCQILKGHFERMSNVVNQSQKMISARRSEAETEQNLKGLAERMHSRFKTDYRVKVDSIKEYEQRNHRMSDEVLARRRVVEELIATVKFDQEALEKYRAVSEEKEHYIKYLKSLSQMDDRAAQDFQLKFGKVGEELHKSRQVLNQSSRYTQTLQQQFSRLCGQFRRVHTERGQAISFWENTLRSMQQRDKDIKEVAEDYAVARQRAQEVEAQCERSQSMLKAEKNNAMALEYQIKSSDKACGETRLKLAQGKEHTLSLNDEILTYNTIINQTSRIVKDVQTKIQSYQHELDMMQQKLEKAQLELQNAKARYDMTLLETMTEEHRTKEIEKLIDQEEQKTEALIQEVEKQRKHLWQRSNDLNVLEQKFKTTLTQIKGTKTIIISLRDRAKNDDVNVQKKKQQAYHLELECLSLDSRIQQIVNAAPIINTGEANSKDVGQFRDKLQEVVKTKGFLTSQESHLDNTNNRLKREISNVIQDHSKLKFDVETQKMEASRFSLDSSRIQTELQNLCVENRLLHMTLKRLTQFAHQERSKMLTLEQERALLESVAQERRSEIDLHMNLLRTQQKLLKEERNKLAVYIMDVLTEVERCKSRYEYIINAMNIYGDDSGHSESYYILKHAQERESLKREGDLWDVKVKETEKEIAALQNTLSVLVSSNLAFKDSLSPAAAETPEAKMLAEMEEQQRIALIRNKRAVKRFNELSKKFLQKQSESAETKHSKMYLEGVLGERKYELNNVHFEIASQKAKIDRANKMAARLIRELGLHVHEDREAIEADLKLRCAREKFEFGLKTLEKNLFRHEEVRAPALNFLVHSELEPIIARLKKRLNTADGNSSPYYSGQVTPIRYLTPISSAVLPPSINALRNRDKLLEFGRVRERPNNAPLLVQPSVFSQQQQQQQSSRGGIQVIERVNSQPTRFEGKRMSHSSRAHTQSPVERPKSSDATTLFKSTRQGTYTSELNMVHPPGDQTEEEQIVTRSVTDQLPQTVDRRGEAISSGGSRKSSARNGRL